MPTSVPYAQDCFLWLTLRSSMGRKWTYKSELRVNWLGECRVRVPIYLSIHPSEIRHKVNTEETKGATFDAYRCHRICFE